MHTNETTYVESSGSTWPLFHICTKNRKDVSWKIQCYNTSGARWGNHDNIRMAQAWFDLTLIWQLASNCDLYFTVQANYVWKIRDDHDNKNRAILRKNWTNLLCTLTLPNVGICANVAAPEQVFSIYLYRSWAQGYYSFASSYYTLFSSTLYKDARY